MGLLDSIRTRFAEQVAPTPYISEVSLSTTSADSELLADAYNRLQDKARWVKGSLAVDSDGGKVWVNSDEAVAFCAYGSLLRTLHEVGVDRAEQESSTHYRTIYALDVAAQELGEEDLTSLNDHKNHSKVLEMYRLAIAKVTRLEQRMRKTLERNPAALGSTAKELLLDEVSWETNSSLHLKLADLIASRLLRDARSAQYPWNQPDPEVGAPCPAEGPERTPLSEEAYVRILDAEAATYYPLTASERVTASDSHDK